MLHKTFKLPTNQPSIRFCHIIFTAVSMQSKGAKPEKRHSLQYAVYAASQGQSTRGLWGLFEKHYVLFILLQLPGEGQRHLS